MNRRLITGFIGMLFFVMVAIPVLASDTIKIAFIDPLSGAFAGVGDSGYKHFLYTIRIQLAQ